MRTHNTDKERKDEASEYSIASTQLRVCISTHGAELKSLQSNKYQEEYLWQGDPAIWAGQAPVLFPVVGALRDDRYCLNGQRYPMSKHGFARNSQFSVCEHTEDRLTLRLTESPETLAQFPWAFALQISFQVQENCLRVNYDVSNTSADTMYFNVGSHPAFRLPLAPGKLDDYSIEFDQAESLDCLLLEDNLLQHCLPEYLQQQRIIALSESLFDRDALVFRDIASRHIALCHKHSGKRLVVDTGGAPHLGLWAKPGAPYVCIEPWWGYADFTDSDGDISHKPGIQKLPPKHSFSTYIALTI